MKYLFEETEDYLSSVHIVSNTVIIDIFYPWCQKVRGGGGSQH